MFMVVSFIRVFSVLLSGPSPGQPSRRSNVILDLKEAATRRSAGAAVGDVVSTKPQSSSSNPLLAISRREAGEVTLLEWPNGLGAMPMLRQALVM